MKRALALAILVLAAALAGCLAADDEAGQAGADREPDRSADQNVNQGCNVVTEDGHLTPADPLVVESSAGAGPVHAEIQFDGEPVFGELHLVFEGPDETIWEDSARGVGFYEHGSQFDGLAAGAYTFTASIEDGAGDASVELLVRWGGGSCS